MTLKDLHYQSAKNLSDSGHGEAFQEAKWLLAGALNKDPSFMILNPHYQPTAAEVKKIQEWLKRRCKGEPLSRLKGEKEFWSLPFHLNEYTLDPRPETEVLLEGCLKWIGNRKNEALKILDLGTGSGCILISLLSELPNATGVGADINEEALSMARHNAKLNNVNLRSLFLQSNWTENIGESFDVIISNPPYIPFTEEKTLPKEVSSFDPPQALFGGEDGLSCYKLLAKNIKPHLAAQGLALFEMGAGQRSDVENIFNKEGFKTSFIQLDLSGIERAIGFRLP